MLRNVFFSILTHFSVGLIFTIIFVSLEEIGRLFFRVTSLVALALILFALAAQPFPELGYLQAFDLGGGEADRFHRLTYLFFILCTASIVIYNLLHPRLHRPLLVMAGIFGLLGVASYSLAFYQPRASAWFEALIHVANGIGSALLLGSVLGAMITGHWYLVQHNLSLNPLKSSSKVYIASTALRILVVGMSVAFYANLPSGAKALSHLASLDFSGLLILSRLTFGLVIPLIFGIMVWKATAIRSTQSATGILYATIVLVLIGETFAKYLYFLLGIPL